MNLIDSIRPEIREKMSDELIKRVNRIDAEDFTLVRKKVVKELAKRNETINNQSLDEMIFALKQYYTVALLDPKNGHAVSIPVDDAWHMHILDTRGYESFCKEVVGAVMPHVHLDFDVSEQVQNASKLYDFTLDRLKEIFVVVSERWWPERQPTANPDTELVCTHFNDDIAGYTVSDLALFPKETRGQMPAFV